jgi:hypothetical protein
MLANIIPSYLYVEYNDDDDLQALVTAFNTSAQEYVTWFNQVGLPIYTGPLIVGDLLDWVAEGLYGIKRTPLPGGNDQKIGMYGTIPYGTRPFATFKVLDPKVYYLTNDDIFKRIITWAFFKGDGKVFNIRWLKRRIMRFLNGVNGVDFNIDQTYQISVSFGTGNQVNIGVLSKTATFVGGSFGATPYGVLPYGASKLKITPFPAFQFAPILKAAIESGALELPFQYTYVVDI